MRFLATALVILMGVCLLSPGGGAAAETVTAEQAVDLLNDAALAAYHRAKAVQLAHTSPVIVVAFDSLVLIRDGQERRAHFTPRLYYHYKAVSHTALGLYGAAVTGLTEPGTDWRASLRTLRERAAALVPRLGELGFTEDRLDRQRVLLTESLAVMDRLIAAGRVSRDEVVAYGRRIAPLLLANLNDAAIVQLDGLHALVSQWRAELGPDEWGRLYAIVLGLRMPRAGNLQFQYFVHAMGTEAVDRRLVYAEGILDVPGGLGLLSTLVTDRGLALAVFGDELRMDRDALADGAAAHLLRLFGRLGPVPAGPASR